MLLPCCYLAPISHYSALFHAEEAHLEVYDNFAKQTLRNRCFIDSPSGPLPLSIPVVKPEGKTPLRDIRISDHGNWRHQHWAALGSSYRQSPFFEYYADEFAPFYEKKWEFLADYNEALMRLIMEELDITTPIQRTQGYEGDAFQLLPAYTPKPYYQMFSTAAGSGQKGATRHPFLPDLSIVDLLFNLGPEGLLWL